MQTQPLNNPPADTEKDRDIVRHNWEKLGYQYWFTGDFIEYWKHPSTDAHLSMVTY